MKKIWYFFNDVLSEKKVIRSLVSSLLIMLILLILISTSNLWWKWLMILFAATKPFIYGYIIAYVLAPFVEQMQKLVKNRVLSIILVVLIFIALLVILFAVAMPEIFTQLVSLTTSLVDGTKDLITFLKEKQFYGFDIYLNDIVTNLQKYLSVENITNTVISFLQESGSAIFNTLNGFLGAMITISTSFMLAFYFLSDRKRINEAILKASKKLHPNTPMYLLNASAQLRNYVGSLGLIMLFKLPEFMLLYWLIGHKNWFILGVLNMFAVVIPYLGPIAVNIVALVTALAQPWTVLLGTAGVIMWSSMIDPYFIDPRIQGKKIHLNTLTVIFSIFFFSTVLGLVGVVFAIPIVLLVRSIFATRKEIKAQNQKLISTEGDIS